MIKALIFDVSGVLTHAQFSHAFEAFAHKINLPESFVQGYFKNSLESQLLGQSNLHDLFLGMSEQLPNFTEAQFKDTLVTAIAEATTINNELLEWIDKLRKTYTCGILTNNTEGRGIFDESIHLHSHFDFVLESYKEHLKKPDPEFFKRGLRHAACKANEAVYIDDQERHIDAASNIGMHGVLYTNNTDLASALKQCGVS